MNMLSDIWNGKKSRKNNVFTKEAVSVKVHDSIASLLGANTFESYNRETELLYRYIYYIPLIYFHI